MKEVTFKKSWLKDYKVIKDPMSKVELTVTSQVDERHRVPTENGHSYIVNLKAIAKDKLDDVLALFKENDEVPIAETNGLFLTGNIWHNEGSPAPELPMKGEKILANIDYVENREGEEVLRVTTMAIRAAATASQFDFDALFNEAADEVENEATIEQGITA